MLPAAGRPLHYALLVSMSLVLFFCNLGGPSLWDVDEGRNATAALEMLERGNPIVPTFNAQLRVDKPALLYWLQMAGYCLFGVSEFAARLPSALAALLTVLLAYELARSMFGAATGFWAAALAATTPMLCGAARFANPDALLNLFTVLTLTLFWMGRSWPRALWFFALGAAAGLAVLAKGPVGICLPAAVVFVFLVWERQVALLWDRRLGWSLVAFLLVAAPWYVCVTVDTKADFVRGFILKHNVNRFLSPMENHAGFPGFYLIVLLIGILPWSIFFVPVCWYSFWSLWRQPRPRWQATWMHAADTTMPWQGTVAEAPEPHRQPTRPQAAYRLLAVWVLFYLIFFTAAATKLPNYVLPLVVPMCILTGRFLERWRVDGIELCRGWLHVSLVCLALTGVALAVGLLALSGTLTLPGLKTRVFPELTPWAWMSVVPGLAALAGWALLGNASARGPDVRRQQRGRWLVCLLLAAVGFWGALSAFANETFDLYKAPRSAVTEAGARVLDQEVRIGGLQVEHLASLHFYVRRNVIHHASDEDARAFLRYPMRVFLFLPGRAWDSWQDRAPSWRVVGRQPDLYRGDDVVVVTNR